MYHFRVSRLALLRTVFENQTQSISRLRPRYAHTFLNVNCPCSLLRQSKNRQSVTRPARLATRKASLRLLGDFQNNKNFSSTPLQREVNVTNPRRDDDGNDMVVDITERAANRLREIMQKDSNPDLALRVSVQSGGCHGFQYLMSLTSAKEASPEDDIVFEAKNGSGARVIMDEPSLELLKGSKVDFTMELIGSQFKIVGNPAATSSCGCGTSFDIKM